MKQYLSHSETETMEIGQKIAATLKKGDVIAFFGELGAGKTALTKGICAYFGIEDVHSPTFTIVNEYYGSKTVYHFDAYRITADDWLNGGFDEYLYQNGICIIEWAEHIEAILPAGSIKIHIARDLSKGDCYREIEVTT